MNYFQKISTIFSLPKGQSSFLLKYVKYKKKYLNLLRRLQQKGGNEYFAETEEGFTLCDDTNSMLGQPIECVEPYIPPPNYRKFLTQADLETLNEGKWLNDQVIDQWADIINMEYQEVFSFNVFFHLNMKQKLRQKDWKRLINKHIKKHLEGQTQIKALLFPLNVTENHWILYDLNIETGVVRRWDSLCTRADEAEDFIGVLQTIYPFLIKYIQPEVSAQELILVEPKRQPKQDNYVDCGVFVCAMLECLARSEVIDDYCLGISLDQWQSNINIIREKLKILYTFLLKK